MIYILQIFTYILLSNILLFIYRFRHSHVFEKLIIVCIDRLKGCRTVLMFLSATISGAPHSSPYFPIQKQQHLFILARTSSSSTMLASNKLNSQNQHRSNAAPVTILGHQWLPAWSRSNDTVQSLHFSDVSGGPIPIGAVRTNSQ